MDQVNLLLTFLSYPCFLCQEFISIAVLFHVTVTLRTRSGAKWRAPYPRPSTCLFCPLSSQTNTGSDAQKKLKKWRIISITHFLRLIAPFCATFSARPCSIMDSSQMYVSPVQRGHTRCILFSGMWPKCHSNERITNMQDNIRYKRWIICQIYDDYFNV